MLPCLTSSSRPSASSQRTPTSSPTFAMPSGTIDANCASSLRRRRISSAFRSYPPPRRHRHHHHLRLPSSHRVRNPLQDQIFHPPSAHGSPAIPIMSPRKKRSATTILKGTSTAANGPRTGSSAQSSNAALKSKPRVSEYSLPLDPHAHRYPKQQRLLNLKKESVDTHAGPSCYLSLQQLPSLHPFKFDVILLDPPFSSSFSWDELQEFPVPSLAADPSFVFMWVGSGAGEGLERGREVLAKWGYRRCEDVVWVKTNIHSNRGPGVSLFAPTSPLLCPIPTSDRSADNVVAHSD